MKPLQTALLAALLAASHSSAQLDGGESAAPKQEDSATPPSIEDAVISITLDGKKPTQLQSLLEMVSKQLETAPSIAFRTGTDSREVPLMNVQRVRFGDLLKALEQLTDVKFHILNPTPKKGESPLITVDATTARIGTPWPSAPPLAVATSQPATESGLASGSGGTSRIGRNEILPSPARKATRSAGGGRSGRAGADARSGTTGGGRGVRQPAGAGFGDGTGLGTGSARGVNPGGYAVSWGADGGAPVPSSTASYAIGSLVNDKESGHSAEEVIEAIRLAWTTADEKSTEAKDGPRIALHEPSSLLIVKATIDLQSLAEQVIKNLRIAQTERRESSKETNRLQVLQEQFRRESAHLASLHKDTLQRLKASHASEVDNLRATVAELEDRLREIRTKSEGGN